MQKCSTLDETECECPNAGFCPRYGITQGIYAHAVCVGKPTLEFPSITQAKSEMYRKKWRRLSVKPLPIRSVAPTRIANSQPKPKQPITHGVGSTLADILGERVCGSIVSQVNRQGIDISPQYRAWLAEYINARWKRRLSSLVSSGVLTSASSDELIDLCIAKVKERDQHEQGNGISDVESVHGPSVTLSTPESPKDHQRHKGGDGNREGTIGSGISAESTIPSSVSESTRRYRVLPVAIAREGTKPSISHTQSVVKKPIKWAYGVTTVPERISHHLPKTLNSLSDAGFSNPRLFVDGGTEEQYKHLGLQVTTRNPKVRAYANWYISLLELFMRNPGAERFAIFQDDIQCVKNLRQYLDLLPFPQRGYLNLTTFWESESLVGNQTPIGIVPAAPQRLNNGQPKKPNPSGIIPQHGRGALGLVFDRDGVLNLLRHPHMTNRVIPDRKQYDPNRCYRLIDGAVVEAMNNAGYTEYVHNPSLVQHAGTHSTITGRTWGAKATSKSFPGSSFDALSLLLASPQPASV